MPKITIYPCASRTKDHTWRCDIDYGPGHHGTGASQAQALFLAACAWMKYEEDHGSQKEA